jgi:hypothetical protein
MKGPAYTDEEQRLLNELAKKGGSPTALAAEFQAQMGDSRSAPALVQKIRKMILDRSEAKAAKRAAKADSSATASSNPPAKRRGRPPKVNTAPLSDAPPAKRRGRPPKAVTGDTISVNGTNGHTNVLPYVNGNGHSDTITVDLGDLKLVGSRKRVGEILTQLG